jgi:hypothetical protein
LAYGFQALNVSRERLKEGFLKTAGNMFLFVKLKEGYIRDQYPSPTAVEQILSALDGIPPSLKKMY